MQQAFLNELYLVQNNDSYTGFVLLDYDDENYYLINIKTLDRKVLQDAKDMDSYFKADLYSQYNEDQKWYWEKSITELSHKITKDIKMIKNSNIESLIDDLKHNVHAIKRDNFVPFESRDISNDLLLDLLQSIASKKQGDKEFEHLIETHDTLLDQMMDF